MNVFLLIKMLFILFIYYNGLIYFKVFYFIKFNYNWNCFLIYFWVIIIEYSWCCFLNFCWVYEFFFLFYFYIFVLFFVIIVCIKLIKNYVKYKWGKCCFYFDCEFREKLLYVLLLCRMFMYGFYEYFISFEKFFIF